MQYVKEDEKDMVMRFLTSTKLHDVNKNQSEKTVGLTDTYLSGKVRFGLVPRTASNDKGEHNVGKLVHSNKRQFTSTVPFLI